MLKRKKVRQRGKVSFTRYFQKFQPGDSVAVVRDLSNNFGYSNRIQGKTGKVLEKRGTSYYIALNDMNKEKRYLLKPIHLKKIEAAK